MYSCGSLAPKMRRGGGCSDAKFRKPSEPWELADGCVHLLAELLLKSKDVVDGDEDCKRALHPLLGDVAAACEHRHYTVHFSFLETVLRRLPDAARGLDDKRTFKRYVDEFLEPVFYALDAGGTGDRSPLCAAAAENCVRFLSEYLGPNILRGRVEQANPR